MMSYLKTLTASAVTLCMAVAVSAQTPNANPDNKLGAPPPLSAFGKLPDIENVALSPNGERVALIKDHGGERAIFDYDLTTGKSAGLIMEKSKLRNLFWGDDDRIVLITSTTANIRAFQGDRNEYAQGYILDVHAGKRFLMYQDMELFSPIVMGNFNRIKSDKGYRVTASNVKLDVDGFRSLYGFSLTTGKGFRIDEDPHGIRNWVLTPDGELIARSEFDWDSKVWTLRYRQNKRWSVIFTQKEAIDYPSLVGLGRDGKSLLVYMDSGPKAGDYYEVSPEGVFSEALEIDGNSRSAIFHPQTQVLAGFANYGEGGTTYSFYDPVMAKLPKLIDKAMAGYTIKNIVGYADNPLKVIIYGEGKDDPGTYYFIDFATGKFKIVGETRPQVPSEWVAEQKLIKYKAADGLEISALITLPPGRDAQDLPLIVLPHGGPQSHDTFGFDWMGQALASRGYVVLQPNFRGSSGYGEDFTKAGHGQWGRKMQTDLSDGVRHLAKEGLIDPKRTCIMGASYGGYASLAGAAIDTGVYRCAAAIAGVSDLTAMVKWEIMENGMDKNASTVLYWKRFMGDESGWDAVSPAQQAAKVTIPVLLIHGKDDDVVPVDQSYRMRDALQKAGKPVEYIALKAEDHWLSKEPTRVQTLESVVTFLETHNPPYQKD
ncbi:alpha/beta hydrolase family protein [Asticcacaulis endophyticus]|nr:S9 family peptidase [Asticcacaulis endophyticus]